MTRSSQRRRDQEIATSSSNSDPQVATSNSDPPLNSTGKSSSSRKRAKSSTTTDSIPASTLSRKRSASSSTYPAKSKRRSSSRNRGSSSVNYDDDDQDEDDDDELTDPEEELEGEQGQGSTSQSFDQAGSQEQRMGAPSFPASGISVTGVKIRKGGGNRRGTAPEARAIHNATERARRESITNRILDLGNRLPSLDGVKRPGKPRIITEALAFVSDARGREIFYRKQIAHLSLEKEKLEKMIEAASKGEVLELVLEAAPLPYVFKTELPATPGEFRSATVAGKESLANRDRNISNASNNSSWVENRDVSGLAMSSGLPASTDPRSQMSYHSSSQGSVMTPGYSPSGSSSSLPPNPQAIASTSTGIFSNHSYPQGFDEHSRRASIAVPGYHSHPYQAAPFYSPTFPLQHQDRQHFQHHPTLQFEPHQLISSFGGGGGGGQGLNSPALQSQFSQGALQSPSSTTSQQHLQSSYPQSPVTSSNPHDSPSYNTAMLASATQNFSASSSYIPHARARSEAGLHYSHYASSSPNQQFQRLNHSQVPPLPSPLSRSKEIGAEEEAQISSFD